MTRKNILTAKNLEIAVGNNEKKPFVLKKEGKIARTYDARSTTSLIKTITKLQEEKKYIGEFAISIEAQARIRIYKDEQTAYL